MSASCISCKMCEKVEYQSGNTKADTSISYITRTKVFPERPAMHLQALRCCRCPWVAMITPHQPEYFTFEITFHEDFAALLNEMSSAD
ncbi:unnamed protein product, partial [Brenthis ino]